MGIVENLFQKRLSKMTREEIMELSTPFEVDKTDDIYTNDNYATRGAGIKKPYKTQKQELQANPGGFVHRSAIIENKAFFVDNPRHRVLMAYYNAWMHAAVFKVSEHLTSERPLFCKPGTENEEDPEEVDAIVDFWEDNRMQECFKKSFEKDAMHGWTLYYPLIIPEKDKRWYTGPMWRIISADESQPYKWRHGHPIMWKVTPTNKYVAYTSNVSLFNTQNKLGVAYSPEPTYINSIFNESSNSDDFDGMPLYIGMWDDLIDYEFICDAVNAFDSRLGNGFLLIVVPNTTSDPDMTNIKAKVNNLRTEKGLVVRGDVGQTVQLDWFGMSGMQVDFVSHLEKIEDRIALTIGFPKRWLLGDQEGAMESSGKDAMQVNVKLKALFNRWKVWMKRVLIYHEIIQDPKEVVIRAPYEMQLSEQEKIELNLVKTQTIAASTWMSVNEQREAMGLEPAAEEGADDVMLQIEDPNQQEDNSNKDESTKTDEHEYTKLDSVIQGNGVRFLAESMGISPTTVSKARANMDENKRPVCKTDSLECDKSDSVMISDDVYKIQNALLIPAQAKPYKHLGYTAVRTPEEIAKAFNDETKPRQFRIGMPNDKNHAPGYLEVSEKDSVGIAVIEKFDSQGAWGSIIYNLKKIDKILGSNNWVRHKTREQKYINTSVALRSVDIPIDIGKRLETNLDTRSFVLTENPRNIRAGGK